MLCAYAKKKTKDREKKAIKDSTTLLYIGVSKRTNFGHYISCTPCNEKYGHFCWHFIDDFLTVWEFKKKVALISFWRT